MGLGLGSFLLTLVRLYLRVYDLLTSWLYSLLQSPAKVRAGHAALRAVPCKPMVPGDTSVTYKPCPLVRTALVSDFEHAQLGTMAEVWTWVVERYSGRKVLGTRDVAGEEDEIQPNGTVFKKLKLGDYRWMSYEEADEIADFLGRGLRLLGQAPGSSVCMFADTRAEWMLTAQACFKQSFPLVTLYTNLGEDAVAHGLNETEADTVFTSHELLPKFKDILNFTPHVKKIVYFENSLRKTDLQGYRADVKLVSFWDIVGLGKKNSTNNNMDLCTEPIPPTPDSTCIIMYTSGSTGAPKGVIITHRNVFKCLNSWLYQLTSFEIKESDRWIGYLPLAHILELLAEMMMLVFGVPIGYSSPNTLTDKSTMIPRGGRGDAAVLRPTVMACVPLVLDRIYKGVNETVRKKGEFFENLFRFCVDYKVAALNKGERTPIMDRIIFKNVRALVGGRLRVIFSGGAPLSPESHQFLRACLGCPLLQGYGLTETTACATLMQMDEHSTGRVGPPVQGVNIRLENWEEGNYRVTDRPRPRGEILVGGENVTAGYFKNEEKTAEEYFTDPAGRRWFRTGDIGQVEDNGSIRIIDRKKDLVKLQFGEYVSLGKVESVLKTCPLVENICIYGDSTKSYVVALVCPDRAQLERLAARLGRSNVEFTGLCSDRDVVGAVLRELTVHAKLMRLEKFEIPGAVSLCQELWTPDSGLVTAAFKLKRRPLQQHYQAHIDRMYGAP